MKQQEYECPNCGAVRTNDIVNGILICKYCNGKEKITSDNTFLNEFDFSHVEQRGSHYWGTKIKNVKCESCGANTVIDANEITNSCVFCKSNRVIIDENIDILTPNGMCIAKLTEIEAKKIAQNYLRTSTKINMDKVINENIFCVYLPFWTIDTKGVCNYKFKSIFNEYKDELLENIFANYKKTNGKAKQFNVQYDDFIVCAKDGYPAYIMDALNKVCNYDLRELQSFDYKSILGIYAERYSLGLNCAWNSVRENIFSRIREENDIVYDIHEKYEYVRYRYIMLPIWFYKYFYDQNEYTILVNAQNGNVDGRFPGKRYRSYNKVSKERVKKNIISIVMGLLFGICMFLAEILSIIFASL